MASWPSVPTVSPAGAAASSTTFANAVKAFLDWLAAPKFCHVYHSAAQTITTATNTALAFNSEREDNDTMHSTVTNNSRITFKTAGIYSGRASVEFASNATGYRGVAIKHSNGTNIASTTVNAVVNSTTKITINYDYRMAVNDYIEVFVVHTRGADLDVLSTSAYSPEFTARLESV